jgi:hypothetical protein
MYFEPERLTPLRNYLASADGAPYMPAIEAADRLIDGFQSPLGMEVLATVDWLTSRQGVNADLESVKVGLAQWPGPNGAATRKVNIFSDELLIAAIDRVGTLS